MRLKVNVRLPGLVEWKDGFQNGVEFHCAVSIVYVS